jgi:hypothetical protein
MDKIELIELINKGESSFVEFKADTPDILAETIAEYVVCFANSKGGKILLGVEDDGTITGLKGRFAEYGTWISVMTISQNGFGCRWTIRYFLMNSALLIVLWQGLLYSAKKIELKN